VKLNPWIVAGGLLVLYALWNAYGPAPSDPSVDASDSGSFDSGDGSDSGGVSQTASNALGQFQDAFGFADLGPLGDDGDVGELDDSSDELGDSDSSDNLFDGLGDV